MDKKKILILMFILSGCTKEKSLACSRYNKDDSIIINLKAVNDDIKEIEICEVFVLPKETLLNEKFFEDLEKQLDDTCQIEENKLVRRYKLIPEGRFSLNATAAYLKGEKYFCE